LYGVLNIEICARVKTGKHLSLGFQVNKGLRHGMELETTVIRSKVVTQGTIIDKCSQIMAYATDVVIMGRILQDVELTNKMQFEISDLKTNFMIVSQKPCNECEYTDTVSFFRTLSII
jgi:hypothetical protein